MFEFHKDKKRYFDWQYFISRDYIVPFVEDQLNLDAKLRVMEIGCAEAGVLKAFIEKGHQCTGVELHDARVEIAKQFLKEPFESGQIQFISKDIYELSEAEINNMQYDLIILKDVIEHIHDQEKFMQQVGKFLAPNGKIFFAFPPWTMPFGGHQQLFRSKFLSKIPYTHLLPRGLYALLLKAFEKQDKVNNLLEIWDTGISTRRFEKIAKEAGYKITKRRFYLFNPIYQYKFNLQPREQYNFISKAFFRDFFTTCAYYLVERE
jgi:2-polyprenyl-3-methyl-5-hydroxy-6-metoxy-1,4-benzoquinol methylase